MAFLNSSLENATNSSFTSSNTVNDVFGCLILALGFLALFGNGLILLVIGKYKALRNNLCNMLIAILAISDFSSGIGLLCRGITDQIFRISGYHDYTNLDCLTIGFIGLFSVQMSQLVTAFIAVDRLQAVRDPFAYATQDKLKTSMIAFSVSVGFSLIGSAIAYIGLDYYAHPEICETGSSVPDFYPAYWILLAFILAIIVFYSYAKTSVLLKRKLRNVNSSIERKDLKKQKEVFKAISLVLVVYATCWCLPNFLLTVATAIRADTTTLGHLSSGIAVGTGIYSSANVFIYAWKHHEIGEHMRKFFNLKIKESNKVATSTGHPLATAAIATTKQMAFASTTAA